MSEELVLSEGHEEQSVPCLPPHSGMPLAFFAFLLRVSYLHPNVSVYRHLDPSDIGSEPIFILILHIYIISKKLKKYFLTVASVREMFSVLNADMVSTSFREKQAHCVCGMERRIVSAHSRSKAEENNLR